MCVCMCVRACVCENACMRACVRAQSVFRPKHYIKTTKQLFHLADFQTDFLSLHRQA